MRLRYSSHIKGSPFYSVRVHPEGAFPFQHGGRFQFGVNGICLRRHVFPVLIANVKATFRMRPSVVGVRGVVDLAWSKYEPFERVRIRESPHVLVAVHEVRLGIKVTLCKDTEHRLLRHHKLDLVYQVFVYRPYLCFHTSDSLFIISWFRQP